MEYGTRLLKPLPALYLAQFLSAFVDNMLLFIAQAIIVRDNYPYYYLPVVQGTFLFVYIVFSPWVGRYADKHAKASVLIHGNLIKLGGVVLFVFGCDPALGYALVGVGAVVYSPAKYGILPYLTTGQNELLQANSRLETYTIAAILSGSVAGGFLTDYSLPLALGLAGGLYGVSLLFTLLIPCQPGDASINYRHALRAFIGNVGVLAGLRQSRYSLVGTGSFWFASAVLRLAVFIWLPLMLGAVGNSEISLVFAATGVGTAVGAIITPALITIRTYKRTFIAGLAIAGLIFVFPAVNSLAVAALVLFLVGVAGGLYVVPLNACLQDVGHRLIGAGKTIAVQNFVENVFMLFGVGAYSLAIRAGVDINQAILATGALLAAMLGYLLWVLHSPRLGQEKGTRC